MLPELNGNEQRTDVRPVGIVQPAHEATLRALKAVDDKRLTDAEKQLEALPDAQLRDRAWKCLVSGLIALERAEFAEAEAALLQSSALALMGGLGSAGDTDADLLRLAARAMQNVGWVYRRQDRCAEAMNAHLTAYRLYRQHGSFDELWETATQLGLDSDVARKSEDGQRWHRSAVNAAKSATEQPVRKQAVSWTHLSASFAEDNRYDEAVAAARTARELWRRHDVGAVTAAQADHKLGGALLKYGESLHDLGEKLTVSTLDETVERLGTAREALLAFGPDHVAEARLCSEQTEFAERLLASFQI